MSNCTECYYFERGKLGMDHAHCRNLDVPQGRRTLPPEGQEACKRLWNLNEARISALSRPQRVQIRNVPFEQFIIWLETNQHFSFVRYGDGEWKALMKTSGRSGGAHRIWPEFHRDMRRVLFRNAHTLTVLFGLQRRTYRPAGKQKEIENFIDRFHLEGINWADADVFHHASKGGNLFPLIRELRKKMTVIVGPGFLRALKKDIFRHAKFIKIPEGNCYREKDPIIDKCLLAQKEMGDNLVFSFSAGPAAEAWILLLQEKMPRNFFIDAGSLWDVFAGRRTRQYTQDMAYTNKIFARNLGKI